MDIPLGENKVNISFFFLKVFPRSHFNHYLSLLSSIHAKFPPAEEKSAQVNCVLIRILKCFSMR